YFSFMSIQLRMHGELPVG
ncbi:Undecaprenyl-phosphate alpha-N-acetylglucosaminyl 1-phosphate transferase, partial [Haemophilus influenzae]